MYNSNFRQISILILYWINLLTDQKILLENKFVSEDSNHNIMAIRLAIGLIGILKSTWILSDLGKVRNIFFLNGPCQVVIKG